MAVSNKLINKKYIKDHVKENLWQLGKDHLIRIAKQYGADVKSKMNKDEIIEILLKTKGVDFWEIYQDNKESNFGIYSKKLEELLDIDTKLRRKLEKKGILQVAYQLENSNYKNSYLNFYSLEPLYKMNKEQWEECKSKYAIKELTSKQKEALAKRAEALEQKREDEREQLRKETTCTHCGWATMDKDYIEYVDGEPYCRNCISKYEDATKHNRALIDFFKDVYSDKEDYLILDIETTDLTFTDICSVSIIDLNGKILFDEIVKPNGQISAGAAEAHGITNEMAQKGIGAVELSEKLTTLFKGKEIIYYSIGSRTLSKYFKDAGIKVINKNKEEREFRHMFKFMNCERYFAIINDDDESEYNRPISYYYSAKKNYKIDFKTANRSLYDTFCIRDGIEYYAQQELEESIFI